MISLASSSLFYRLFRRITFFSLWWKFFRDTFGESSVHLEFYHKFLLIDKLWETGRALLLQKTYILKLFFKITFFTFEFIPLHYINPLPVSYCSLKWILCQHKSTISHMSVFRTDIKVLVCSHFFIKWLQLFFKFRNTFSLHLSKQFIVKFLMFLWCCWVLQKSLNVIKQGACTINLFRRT